MEVCEQVARIAGQDGKPPVCFAVVDWSGTLRYFYRMDGAPARLVSIVIGKAYTAARMETSTQAFQTRLAREGLTLADFCDIGLTTLPGGIPLRTSEGVFGAVGVSGRTLEDDHALAESFVRVVNAWAADK